MVEVIPVRDAYHDAPIGLVSPDLPPPRERWEGDWGERDAPGRRYAVGFMFSPDLSKVVLIRKRRPEWQAGRLNGPGGKLRDGEAPLAGMQREFHEETGVKWEHWQPGCRLDCPGATVWCFWARSPAYADARTTTDEEVEVHGVANFCEMESITNAQWVVPMLLSLADGREHARCFTVREVH